MAERLSDEEIERRLKSLPGWSVSEGKLTRRFEFQDFIAAFGWMSSVALVAERMDHHPDWKNVYRTVEVELSTHDAGGITHKDFDLAKAMSERAERPA